jgi:hypothetical protein
MPYTPTTPESVEASQPVSVDLDVIYVTSISILLNPNDSSKDQIRVEFSEGYNSGENFVAVRRKSVTIEGQDFLDLGGAIVTVDSTRYDEIKNAVYGYLSANGHIPGGTVS